MVAVSAAVLAREVNVALNRDEHVIEFGGDASGEDPEGVHFL